MPWLTNTSFSFYIRHRRQASKSNYSFGEFAVCVRGLKESVKIFESPASWDGFWNTAGFIIFITMPTNEFIGQCGYHAQKFEPTGWSPFPGGRSKLIRFLHDEVLQTYLKDNVKTRLMLPDCTYKRLEPGKMSLGSTLKTNLSILSAAHQLNPDDCPWVDEDRYWEVLHIVGKRKNWSKRANRKNLCFIFDQPFLIAGSGCFWYSVYGLGWLPVQNY